MRDNHQLQRISYPFCDKHVFLFHDWLKHLHSRGEETLRANQNRERQNRAREKAGMVRKRARTDNVG